MKKREVLIVVLLIIFGVSYSAFKDKEKDFNLLFFDECSVGFHSTSLRDRQSPNPFPQEKMRYTGLLKLQIDNPAGGIEVFKSPDNDLVIEPEIIVYHRDKTEAEKIYREFKIDAAQTAGHLKIETKYKGDFPYRRARIFFKVYVPQEVEINLWNRHGDIAISDTGKNVFLDLKHGNIRAKNIPSTLTLRHRHGRVILADITGAVDLFSQHNQEVTIENIGPLKMNVSHATISIKGVEGNTEVVKVSHCTLDMENGQGFTMDGQHTPLTLKNMRGDVGIKNSHSRIHLQDIKGKIEISGRHCRVKLDTIEASDLKVKNSFDATEIAGFQGNTIDIDQSHGEINITWLTLGEKLNIVGAHCDIHLSYPSDVGPAFDVQLNYGKVINHTDQAITITKNDGRTSLKTGGGSPQVVIQGKYGDLVLNNK